MGTVHNAALRRSFRTLLVVCCGFGVTLGILNAYDLKTMLSFYTEQSNMLVFVVFAVLLIRDFAGLPIDGRIWRILKGMTTIGILLTMIVYQFILRPVLTAEGVILKLSVHNLIVHLITPLLVLIDYALFDPKGSFRWTDPMLWSLFPIAYISYTYIYIGMGGRYWLSQILSFDYPYFFMDYKTLGWPLFFGLMGALLAGYFAACYLLVLLDSRLVRGRRAKM